MSRIPLAFRAFFAILFQGILSDKLKRDLGLAPSPVRPAAPAAPPPPNPAHALQLLAILQRDSRLVDFLMEDIASFDDDQIGAAVRSLHDQARDSLARYLSLQPVIDGVEGRREPGVRHGCYVRERTGRSGGRRSCGGRGRCSGGPSA